MLEELVHRWALEGAALLEAVAAVLIVGASLRAVWGALATLGPQRSSAGFTSVRANLSRWLALALELLIGSDIVRTAVAPSWTEIGQLAAIVLLRIAIDYDLTRSIERNG